MPRKKHPFIARKAIAKDAPEMVRLQRLAVEKTWRSIITKNFQDFLAERFNSESQTQKYIERMDDPARILMVVETGDKIVGFGGARVHEAEETPPGFDYQANAFYLDPAFEGTGASMVLLSGLLLELKKRNAQTIVAWCLAENRGARNFYERRGGKLVEDAVAPPEYNIAPHVAYGWTL